jgi:hypothetical protein
MGCACCEDGIYRLLLGLVIVGMASLVVIAGSGDAADEVIPAMTRIGLSPMNRVIDWSLHTSRQWGMQ